VLIGEPTAGVPCLVDTMVLGMFVDAGRADLLAALAVGRIYLTPSILDPAEQPPFVRPPIAEFAKGVWHAQQDLGRAISARRVQRRVAYYQSGAWHPVALSVAELQRAAYLASRAARDAARAANPAFKAKRVDPGEAECAAVAIERGWELWSDDGGIVALMRTLHPHLRVERLCGLLIRAVRAGLIPCTEAEASHSRSFGEWEYCSGDGRLPACFAQQAGSLPPPSLRLA